MKHVVRTAFRLRWCTSRVQWLRKVIIWHNPGSSWRQCQDTSDTEHQTTHLANTLGSTADLTFTHRISYATKFQHVPKASVQAHTFLSAKRWCAGSKALNHLSVQPRLRPKLANAAEKFIVGVRKQETRSWLPIVLPTQSDLYPSILEYRVSSLSVSFTFTIRDRPVKWQTKRSIVYLEGSDDVSRALRPRYQCLLSAYVLVSCYCHDKTHTHTTGEV